MASCEQFGTGNMPHPCLYALVVVISAEVSGNCGSFECWVRFNCGIRHSDIMLASLLSSCFCLQSKCACKWMGGLRLIDEIRIPVMCMHDVYASGSQIYCGWGECYSEIFVFRTSLSCYIIVGWILFCTLSVCYWICCVDTLQCIVTLFPCVCFGFCGPKTHYSHSGSIKAD